MSHAVLSMKTQDGKLSLNQLLIGQMFLDASAEEMTREMVQVMSDLDVSESCALDVVYLRTRSRHTPELEQRLIELHQKGTPPSIMDFR